MNYPTVVNDIDFRDLIFVAKQRSGYRFFYGGKSIWKAAEERGS